MTFSDLLCLTLSKASKHVWQLLLQLILIVSPLKANTLHAYQITLQLLFSQKCPLPNKHVVAKQMQHPHLWEPGTLQKDRVTEQRSCCTIYWLVLLLYHILSQIYQVLLPNRQNINNNPGSSFKCYFL